MSVTRFDSILVANRGEIACRVIRTARALGIRAIAVYSDADRDAPHVALADEALRLGPAPARESYLSSERLIEAARASDAEAIHPGYGFLSENADFARAVEAAGLVFIGPPAAAIEAMGDKAGAKRAMIAAGVPTVPGYQGEEQDDARLIEEAERIGFPIMAKASAGGGGRGLRLVESAQALPEALTRARAEALNAFGSDKLILERAIARPRHVEIQVFADAHGHVIHLGERDCSVQRRHQKVIEEAPSPALTPELRARMGAAAVEAARAVGYRGAGTVEFLLDGAGKFYFLEMNTRLQVEHPVTEMIAGLDLVAWQIRVALGEPLPINQGDVKLSGHAIEARLYAEDPANDFLPCVGNIDVWRPASGEGVRVDAGVATGQTISPYYDPMLAKIVAHGETREIARQRLIAALEATVALGVTTNADFLIDLLRRRDFVDGAATTAFIGEHYPNGFSRPAPESSDVARLGALRAEIDARRALAASTLPDDSLLGFASAHVLPSRLDLEIEDQVYRLAAQRGVLGWTVSNGEQWRHDVAVTIDSDEAHLVCEGRKARVSFHLAADDALTVALRGRTLAARRHRPWETAAKAAGSGLVTAPMPGIVVAVMATEGQRVTAGEALVVLEAMKMQHTLVAAVAGVVKSVSVTPGRQVPLGAKILEIEEETA